MLGVSVSKVSRMETGARAVSEQDIAALIRHFDISAVLAEEMAGIARSGRRRRDPAPYVPAPETDHLAFVRSGFVELERDAERVREFNSGLVPGLLQHVDYMRALMLSSVPDVGGSLERAIDLRQNRQKRLEVDGRYLAIVDEAVLARVVGGPAVMKTQIDLILNRIEDGAVDVRVIPFAAGAHPGLNSVFVMLTMSAVGLTEVVFIEGLVGHQRFDRPDDVVRFERVWNQLHAAAASVEGSRSLLARYRALHATPQE